MRSVGTALGDHVDRRALAPPIGRAEPLCRNIEFLHGFERKLHHRPAHRVVLVVDSVDGDVHVASGGPVDPEHRNAVLGRIVGVHGLGARRQKRQVREIAPV